MWRPRGCIICKHGIHVFVDPAEIESSFRYRVVFRARRRGRIGGIPNTPWPVCLGRFMHERP